MKRRQENMWFQYLEKNIVMIPNFLRILRKSLNEIDDNRKK